MTTTTDAPPAAAATRNILFAQALGYQWAQHKSVHDFAFIRPASMSAESFERYWQHCETPDPVHWPQALRYAPDFAAEDADGAFARESLLDHLLSLPDVEDVRFFRIGSGWTQCQIFKEFETAGQEDYWADVYAVTRIEAFLQAAESALLALAQEKAEASE